MSLAQGNNTPNRPRIEPGSPDPESEALTTRPVRSPLYTTYYNFWLFFEELAPGVWQISNCPHGTHGRQGAGVDLQQVAGLVTKRRLHTLVNSLTSVNSHERMMRKHAFFRCENIGADQQCLCCNNETYPEFQPRHEKIGFLHIQKQRRRSASRLPGS